MKSAIELPDRVVFVNLGDRNAFFECSPKEARAAINAIEHFRENDGRSREQVETSRVVNAVKEYAIANYSTSEPISLICTSPGISARLMADWFAKIEQHGTRVTHILMNAVRYADLRKWDRDTIDIETKMWKLQLGIMATMWSAEIIVTKDIPDNVVIVMNNEDTKNAFDVYNLTLCDSGSEPEPMYTSTTETIAKTLGAILERMRLMDQTQLMTLEAVELLRKRTEKPDEKVPEETSK